MSSEKKPTYASPIGTHFAFNGKSLGSVSGFPTGFGLRLDANPAPLPIGPMRYVDYTDFGQLFDCDVMGLPQNMCAVGWLTSERRWYCAPKNFEGMRATHASHLFHLRNNEGLLALITRSVVEPMGLPRLWFPFCFYDGWRERTAFTSNYRYVKAGDLQAEFEWRGGAGEIPIFSRDRSWLACFGAHRGDPSALLLPDLYYLRDRYSENFAEVEQAKTPWQSKAKRAVLAAGDHGESQNFFVPPSDPTLHPRRLFKHTVEKEALAIDVFLGQAISRATQMGYRYIADVDGFARTWDAWAWKMMSGCTVISYDSIWDSFFSQQFNAWEHYVPIANDCSDLASQLDWCMNNDAECEAIAARARQRATLVYSNEHVAQRMRENFAARLKSEPKP